MTGRQDYQWLWDFLPTMKWTFAKTMPHSPHWWICEGKTPGLSRADFLRAVEVIRTHGQPGRYFGRPNLYVTNPRGNLKVWCMPGDPLDLDRMHILNLATTDRVYGDQTLTAADRVRLDALALPPGRLSSPMGQWLARDLFDSLPDPESD